MDAKSRLALLLNIYPPFFGAGVRVRKIPDGYEATLRLRWWNRNYVGTHFGGSLFVMADPFYMLILAPALGREYVVWDKASTIRFRRPGRGTVRGTFTIEKERIEEIRAEADRLGKVEPSFTVQLFGAEGEVIAEVDKVLSVRRADHRATAANG